MRDRLIEQSILLGGAGTWGVRSRLSGGLRGKDIRNEHCVLTKSVTSNIGEVLGGVEFECGDGGAISPRVLDSMLGSM